MQDNNEAGASPRTHPFPGNVLMHVHGMGTDSEDMPDHTEEVRTVVEDLDAAMVLTSTYVRRGPLSRFANPTNEPLHRPVLDIDLPVTLLSSTTPGHHHLLIDHPMTWSRYLDLLDALVNAGIVEPGYVKAAQARGHTAVRVPWLRKGDPAPDLPTMTNAEISDRVAKLFDLIAAAPDRTTLEELWVLHADVWTERHTQASKRRLEVVAA
jgi:hypothetical protein